MNIHSCKLSRTCDPRCSLHGTCHDGQCQCHQGWHGTFCTLDGCPNACHGHGECVHQHHQATQAPWSCQCSSGWTGSDCSIKLEESCDDDVDNDEGDIKET